jgi:hypothetical protein
VSGSLRCYSFHSVKGGVGKSTLSVLTALGLAQRGGRRVTLVDMDLTGTSLADVLPLEAPAWEGQEASAPLELLKPPTGFLSLDETRERMELRDELALEASEAAHQPFGAPFLNDFLLFATPDWDEQREVDIGAMLWRLSGGPGESLRVVPSSALPSDLNRTIPVIFDENHSGFLEGRLEYLLDALVPEEGEAVVVVDTPPTIPGLSRSVLSLALRLSREPKQPLAEDGFMPERLQAARVHWTAFVVGSMDHQDLRAANRWLSQVSEEERPFVRFLVNRVQQSDAHQLQHRFREVIGNEPNPLLNAARVVTEGGSLQFFQANTVPSVSDKDLAFLEEA